MTPAERAAQAHLLAVWQDFPIGTRVVVRNWTQAVETASEPWINPKGIAVIRVTGPGGLGPIEIILSSLSIAGPAPGPVSVPLTMPLSSALRLARPDERLRLLDRPEAMNAAVVALAVTIIVVALLKALLSVAP